MTEKIFYLSQFKDAFPKTMDAYFESQKIPASSKFRQIVEKLKEQLKNKRNTNKDYIIRLDLTSALYLANSDYSKKLDNELQTKIEEALFKHGIKVNIRYNKEFYEIEFILSKDEKS